jgi:hypothetical protein
MILNKALAPILFVIKLVLRIFVLIPFSLMIFALKILIEMTLI